VLIERHRLSYFSFVDISYFDVAILTSGNTHSLFIYGILYLLGPPRSIMKIRGPMECKKLSQNKGKASNYKREPFCSEKAWAFKNLNPALIQIKAQNLAFDII
jgi:hypothetical protein